MGYEVYEYNVEVKFVGFFEGKYIIILDVDILLIILDDKFVEDLFV